MTFREWIDWILGRKPPPPPPPPAGADLLTMHNDERRRRGIVALAHDARLMAAAAGHVAQMAISGTLSHDGLADRVAASGYRAVRVGENVACGRGMDASACWALWVASPQHLRNAIDPSFRDMDFASSVSARDGQTYWCVVYGTTV